MPNNLYIASVEPRSSKSLAALGVMEWLSRRTQRLGFFRPVIRVGDQPDNDIELFRQRYNLPFDYDSLYAISHEDARRLVIDDQFDELLKIILAKYKQLQRDCDFVVCEGTDFTGVASAFEFDFNAYVANHLGCSVLIVASGQDKAPDEMVGFLHATHEAFRDEGCEIAATLVNRVPSAILQAVQDDLAKRWTHPSPVYLLPHVDSLNKPTVDEIATYLRATRLLGGPSHWQREVRQYKVAAMQLPNFLDHLLEGDLIITPGDRADVIVATLATVFSEGHATASGLLLTGGLDVAPQVRRLIDGFGKSAVPVMSVETDTYDTANRVEAVPAVIQPGNDRKIQTALGVFEAAVDMEQLSQRVSVMRTDRITPLMFEYELIERAKQDRKHIVLPEGEDERILRAAEILHRRQVVDLTLLGDESAVRAKASSLGVDLRDIPIVDPDRHHWHSDFAETYQELRQHKGITLDVARDTMRDVSYFGTMMVYRGLVDGMVSGAAHTTAHTIRPAFEFIKTKPDCSVVSSVFLMCLADRVLIYGDCAVIPNPTPEQQADIAVRSAETAEMFDIEPRIAMLSYSTGESGTGEDVDRVRRATQRARQLRPDLMIDGPIQYDAAVDASVAKKKLPGSEVAGRATVFVFPDLNTGNNTYKAVQRSSGAVAIGPVLQGLKKPVNDLSRGCLVPDIVNTVAITAIQAQNAANRKDA